MTDLITQDEIGLERLQRAPVITRILATPDGAKTLSLIKATVAPDCTDAEVGHFLELCSVYGLDPFAKEAWCAKGNGGKLLIMVGRDGLRKIAQRNGLHMDGDVIREGDEFMQVRTPDGNRTVSHSYGVKRGALLGAWAEVRKGGPTGVPLGYFYAPLDEYMPANVSSYSPWSKQTSVMILAAAERQAVRQATPLGGLLAVGEDESANASATVGESAPPSVSVELPEMVEEVIARGVHVGHERYGNRARVAMEIGGQSIEATADYYREAMGAMQTMRPADEEPETITDAEVVPEDDVAIVDEARRSHRAESLRANAAALREEADALAVNNGSGVAVAVEEMRAEAAAIEAEADAIAGGQERML